MQQNAIQMRLVLHADDLGLNREVTDGILQAFKHGLLTSTSILANSHDFERALRHWDELLLAKTAGELPSQTTRASLGDPGLPFDLGVHLNLTQGKPLTGRNYPSALLDNDGRFPGIARLFWTLSLGGSRFRRAIRNELAAQIERVRSVQSDVTHLNGHQYVELVPLVGDLVLELASHYGIRCIRLACEPGLWRTLRATKSSLADLILAGVKRWFGLRFRRQLFGSELRSPVAFFGTVHAGRIDLKQCQAFLNVAANMQIPRLPTSVGNVPLLEIAFHPGLPMADAAGPANSDAWLDPLAHLRAKELELLTGNSLVGLLQESVFRLGRLK